ncbi:MAG: hypothetical protein JNG90_12380 [Planctomycetaceae bacterium]|nr:hypothetical protein [Planctomycetaceae bacterium]
MAGTHPPADWQRLDLTPMTGVRAPFAWVMVRRVSSTFGRGMRFGLLLAAGFWLAIVTFGLWLAH